MFELRWVRYKAPYGDPPRLALEYRYLSPNAMTEWKEVPVIDSPEYAELRKQQGFNDSLTIPA